MGKRSRIWISILSAATAGAAALVLSGCSVISLINLAEENTSVDSSANADDGSSGGDSSDDNDDSNDLGETTDVFSLEVGDCVNDPSVSEEEESAVFEVTTVDCATAHDYEIYKSVMLPDGEFPGEENVYSSATNVCLSAFTSFANIDYYESTDLDFFAYYPSEDSWASGDQEVLCAIYEIDGSGSPVQATESLQAAAR